MTPLADHAGKPRFLARFRTEGLDHGIAAHRICQRTAHASVLPSLRVAVATTVALSGCEMAVRSNPEGTASRSRFSSRLRSTPSPMLAFRRAISMVSFLSPSDQWSRKTSLPISAYRT